ncbi:AAA family ATPase [soil metagenome]
MTLAERLAELVRAAFPGLWVTTHEPDDAVAEIARLCHEQGWSLATWDLERGLAIAGRPADAESNAIPGAADPLAAIRALQALATPDGTALLVLRNYHRFLGSPEVVQAVEAALARGKNDRTFVVVLAPVIQLPVELERQFVTIDHELPGREQLEAIARSIATEPGELPSGDGLTAVLDAAAGLTRQEAEGAFALSLVRHGRLAPEPLWEIKSGTLKASGLLTLHRGGETFADLGGLDSIKSSGTRALRPGRRSDVQARGILLLGPPGSGKSAFARALGAETGRPTITLDIGALLGSLVGQTEQNVRRALRIVDAMAPCVLFCDELDKGLSGVASGGSADSGVGSRLFGSLLTWLSEHESDVFFVGTANDISKLPPELTRSERLDAIYFLDLPSVRDRDRIWRMYIERFGLDPQQRRPRDTDWTGAEVKSCCRLSALLDIPLVEAARNIVPVAVTAAEAIERLRNWASGRCLSADVPGLYTRNGQPTGTSGRNVQRGDPSPN